MKTYLPGDPTQSNADHLISGEVVTGPVVAGTPVFLGHDIFFGDTLVLYTVLADPVGSALQKDRDYQLVFLDTIATDQSSSDCYRQVVFFADHATVYANYRAYGDMVTVQLLTEISTLTETLEPRISAAEGDIDTLQTLVSDHSGRISTLEGEVADYGDELADHDSRIEFLEGQNSDKADEIASLSGEADNHEGRIVALEGTLGGLTSTIAQGAMMMFDANAPGPIVSAGSFIIGRQYKINTVGTTDFTLIGAATNTVGITFTATGVGGGSGNANDLLYSTGSWADNVTMPGWYACVPANAPFGVPDMTDRFLMGKVIAGAGSFGGTNSYQIASTQLPTHTHSIDHDHATVTSSIQSNGHSHALLGGAGGSSAVIGSSAGSVAGYDGSGSTYAGGYVGNNDANHVHAVDLPTYTGSSGNGGFSNVAVDNRPAEYSVVVIKKCA